LDSNLSLFSQIGRGFSTIPNKNLRNSSTMFNFSFKGETVNCDNAAYLLLIESVCQELQSIFLPLLVPTQNQKLNVGSQRDMWQINPNATNDDLQYVTLGVFIGSALRTKNYLNLRLPILFFKHLLFETVTSEDLKEIDYPTYKLLCKLRNPDAYNITSENFSTIIDKKFVYHHGETDIELCGDGANIPVTIDNAAKYAELLEKHLLFENPKAYESIRKGISVITPIDRLSLFTAEQLRTLVCGISNINIEILKENTLYENCHATDQHIEWFWECMTEQSPKDKILFMNIVFNVSRLTTWNLSNKPTIAKHTKPGAINTLNITLEAASHKIEIPSYTSKDIMKEKLSHFITHTENSEEAEVVHQE